MIRTVARAWLRAIRDRAGDLETWSAKKRWRDSFSTWDGRSRRAAIGRCQRSTCVASNSPSPCSGETPVDVAPSTGMSRTVAWRELGYAVLVAGLGGCMGSGIPSDPSWPPPGPPHQAYELLRDASEVQSDQVGYFATPSPYAGAFRELLSRPDAKRAVYALLREGTLPGQLYGVAGLHFVGPDAFPAHLERLLGSGKTVTLRSGCVSSEIDVRMYLKRGDRMRVPRGKTLAEAASSGACDIAGGGLPLTCLGGDHRAARDPL